MCLSALNLIEQNYSCTVYRGCSSLVVIYVLSDPFSRKSKENLITPLCRDFFLLLFLSVINQNPVMTTDWRMVDRRKAAEELLKSPLREARPLTFIFWRENVAQGENERRIKMQQTCYIILLAERSGTEKIRS